MQTIQSVREIEEARSNHESESIVEIAPIPVYQEEEEMNRTIIDIESPVETDDEEGVTSGDDQPTSSRLRRIPAFLKDYMLF